MHTYLQSIIHFHMLRTNNHFPKFPDLMLGIISIHRSLNLHQIFPSQMQGKQNIQNRISQHMNLRLRMHYPSRPITYVKIKSNNYSHHFLLYLATGLSPNLPEMRHEKLGFQKLNIFSSKPEILALVSSNFQRTYVFFLKQNFNCMHSPKIPKYSCTYISLSG